MVSGLSRANDESILDKTPMQVVVSSAVKTDEKYSNAWLKRMTLVADGRHQPSASLLAVPCNRTRFASQIGGNPETNTPPIMPYLADVMDDVRVSRTACYRTDFLPRLSPECDNDTVDVNHFNDGSGDVENELVKDQLFRDRSEKQTLDHQQGPRH